MKAAAVNLSIEALDEGAYLVKGSIKPDTRDGNTVYVYGSKLFTGSTAKTEDAVKAENKKDALDFCTKHQAALLNRID